MRCLLSSTLLFFSLPNCFGHGYLKSPRSRNWVAAQDGVNSGGEQSAGKPAQESCPHCLNEKTSNNLCSQGNAATLYDEWDDVNGDAMPWSSEGTYGEGDNITVEAFLSTNHAGHMDMFICPHGNDSTQDCLWNNPLTMISDDLYNGPTDSTYPERAYFANDQSEFKYTYKLPEGVCGEKVLVQWRYITANSCFPPGYKNTAVSDRLQELGWLRASGMSDCVFPYDPTGATGAGKPEQFWNCAEITITCTNPTVSPAPSPPPQPTPVTTLAPIGSPTGSPVAQPTFAYCNYGGTHDTSRERCDGEVEGGTWCNENQSQCEGPCNGNWCTTGAPTPVTASPTIQPTSSPSTAPSSSPTTEPTQCVDDQTERFFFKKRNNGTNRFENCEWLRTERKAKQNRICRKFTDSSPNGNIGPAKDVCREICGTCPTSNPTQRPTESPTGSPSKKNTLAPNKSPSKGPTKTPTSSTSHPSKSPVSSDACCSQFFNICKDNPWCQDSEENCTTCNGVFLSNLPLQCIPRYGMCTNDENGCCYPSTCISGNGTSKQCMYSP